MSELPQFRLLLAEDEPTQRLLLERQLKNAGYIVETASDGQFQILITDWDMPGMDGATLCRRVREANLPTYLYVLLLTSHASTADVVMGLEAGADDYVRKPPVPAELIARLTAGKRIVQLEQSLREANARLSEANDRIQLMSVTDSMLNIFNRRYLNEQIVREVERARRYDQPLSAVMTDLDRFKRINDERGHAAGDEVLVRFAELAKSAIRKCDWMARFGGEEFVIVLPGTTLAGAVATAEKIRALCCAEPFSTSNGQLMVTASFGVAQLHAPDMPPDGAAATLLREADGALYTSKHEGRNRVTCAAGGGTSQ
jgi:two-component system cell cycle response regulator